MRTLRPSKTSTGEMPADSVNAMLDKFHLPNKKQCPASKTLLGLSPHKACKGHQRSLSAWEDSSVQVGGSQERDVCARSTNKSTAFALWVTVQLYKCIA